MAATFNVMVDFGGSDGSPGTSTNTDALGPPNLRFKRADNATIDTSNPCIVPTSGTSYSRWKSIYLKCTGAPSTQVDNVKIYTDGGGFGTGIAVKVGLQFPTKNSGSSSGYEVAGTDDEELVAGHGGITTSASLFDYTSGSALSVSISESGSIINATNETTNYVLLQMETISTASPGNLTDETITWSYDEI